MYLDSEPRPISRHRQQHQQTQLRRHARNASGNSGFFSSRRHVDSPRDSYGYTQARRKPLQERWGAQNLQPVPGSAPSSPKKRTVRIIPNDSGTTLDDQADLDWKKQKVESEIGEERHTDASAGEKPANVRSQPGLSVSDACTAANQMQPTPASYSNALPESRIHGVGAWHRRSGSTGNFSTSSTLAGDSSFFGRHSTGSRSRLSQGTTLRGTPTPYDDDHINLPEAAKSVQSLQTLPEASPERSSVRVVPAEPATLRTEPSYPELPSAATQSSPVVRVLGISSSPSNWRRGSTADRSSRRTSSTGSLPTPSYLRDVSVIHYPRAQRSQDSLAASETSLATASSPNFAVFSSEDLTSEPPVSPSSPNIAVFPSDQPVPPSSPNYVAFYSDGSRPQSRSHPLRGVASYESIESRLQSTSRPDTGTFPFLEPSSSADTLPPLQVPKKRLRHKPTNLTTASSASARSAGQDSTMVTEEEIDTLPYPRYQFSSHLSTIASESERGSKRSSVPLSHFSLGSGVTTLDDASSIPLSSRRRGSAPIASMLGSAEQDTSSGENEEPGDMTLGIYREESAKPQPLFRDKRYDGPLPPLPPVPRSRDSDENFDTVSELGMPPLREQRSGYSLRTRSNSTPSRSQSQSRRSQSHSRHLSQMSYTESDRGSHASSLFPVWAKQFYKNNVPLMSASKISLSGHAPRPGNPHLRNDSQWTERSITSRLGTGYSEIESTSPTSSHFLPSIFRPRTRGQSNAGKKKKGKGRPSGESSRPGSFRPDSMAIGPDPLPPGEVLEKTESGQPKFGELKDGSEPRRPLPRKYSGQRRWNEMTFPRPMTKDRLSDFGIHAGEPRLGPSKRASNRLSMWRAPSFVESLDSLVRSRANRQILLFALGFVLPLTWMLAAVLPIPERPISASELEKSLNASEDDVAAAMMKHEAGDAEKRWRDEKLFLKARWWRSLNRIMSVVGLLVIGAVIALAVVATT